MRVSFERRRPDSSPNAGSLADADHVLNQRVARSYGQRDEYFVDLVPHQELLEVCDATEHAVADDLGCDVRVIVDEAEQRQSRVALLKKCVVEL